MGVRSFRWFLPMVCCAGLLSMLSSSIEAAVEGKDPFSAMRIRRIAAPLPSNLILLTADGRPLRLSDLRGKAVLVEFFLAN